MTLDELRMRIEYLEFELHALEDTTWEDDIAWESGQERIQQIYAEISEANDEMDNLASDPYNMKEVYGIYNKI